MGAPITDPATAAMPTTVSMTIADESKPRPTATAPARYPSDAPRNNAGENTPPTRPSPIQTTVAASLATSISAASPTSFSPANRSFTDWVPSPTASGTSMPIRAISVAANSSMPRSLLRALAHAAVRNSERIKTIANIAAQAPRPSTTGINPQSVGLAVTEYGDTRSKKSGVTAVATIADTVMGATALTAKCRSMASDTSTMAAIGAPNPAEIAAATPHAT